MIRRNLITFAFLAVISVVICSEIPDEKTGHKLASYIKASIKHGAEKEAKDKEAKEKKSAVPEKRSGPKISTFALSLGSPPPYTAYKNYVSSVNTSPKKSKVPLPPMPQSPLQSPGIQAMSSASSPYASVPASCCMDSQFASTCCPLPCCTPSMTYTTCCSVNSPPTLQGKKDDKSGLFKGSTPVIDHSAAPWKRVFYMANPGGSSKGPQFHLKRQIVNAVLDELKGKYGKAFQLMLWGQTVADGSPDFKIKNREERMKLGVNGTVPVTGGQPNMGALQLPSGEEGASGTTAMGQVGHYSRDDVLRQLMILEELRKKKVITRKEYRDKRKLFLDDLV